MPRTLLPAIVLLSALLLSACAPAVLHAPTAPAPVVTPAPLNTTAPSPLPPTPTASPLPPTPTLTPAPTTLPPYIGALTPEQREHLNAIAQSYISLTPEEAQTTAINLDFIGRNANPATVCGPLSIAILQQVGLVDASIKLGDFWYLDPRPGQDERMLQQVFPAERFEKIEQPLSIRQVDYSANPLYPGDFLYLFAGDSGSFEHMLVVSRVDDAGRAYAVTNINTAEGVIVDEVMLYDPANPGVGQFYEWTDWEMRMIGRTGYGGFWLWRPLTTTP